jgi:hypothetical protein
LEVNGMDRRRKLIMVAAAAVLAVGIGAGAVVAASSDDDQPLRGDALKQATEAALDHVGGGTVIETEVGDDGAAYGVEIRKADGNVVEVSLDESFEVIDVEGDDDGSEGSEAEDDDASEAEDSD